MASRGNDGLAALEAAGRREGDLAPGGVDQGSLRVGLRARAERDFMGANFNFLGEARRARGGRERRSGFEVRAVHAGAGIRGGEGSEVEAQGLHRSLEGAQPRGFALELIEEVIRLGDKRHVAVRGRNLAPVPRRVAEAESAPPAVVEFDLKAAAGRVELERAFVGGLKLVNCVIHEDVAMTSADICGVLDGDALEHLVGAIAQDAIGRTNDALHPIGRVGQSILDGSTAGFPVAIVSLGIVHGVGGAQGRKILTAGRCHVSDGTQFTGAQEVAGIEQQWVDMQNIGDERMTAGLIADPQQFVDVRAGLISRLTEKIDLISIEKLRQCY